MKRGSKAVKRGAKVVRLIAAAVDLAIWLVAGVAVAAFLGLVGPVVVPVRALMDLGAWRGIPKDREFSEVGKED